MKKKRLKEIIKSKIITKTLILLIFFMSIFIIKKINPEYTRKLKNNLFNKTINFIKINNFSKKIIGKDVVYSKNNDAIKVMENELSKNENKKYYDGEKLKVTSDLPIGTIESGVVIYIGQKNEYKNVVIIQGIDGYNIWYGNLNNINCSQYNYVEKNSLIGNADGDYIYLVIEKDGKYFTYEEYQENKNKY